MLSLDGNSASLVNRLEAFFLRLFVADQKEPHCPDSLVVKEVDKQERRMVRQVAEWGQNQKKRKEKSY